MAKKVWLSIKIGVKVRCNMSDTNANSQSDDTRCEVCPLSRVKAGVAVRVRQLCAKPELQTRLREIGIREDQIIRLLTSQSNFICQVCDSRLAISEQLARLIMVEPLKPAPAFARSRNQS